MVYLLFSIQLQSESTPHLIVMFTSFWLTRILLEDRNRVLSNSNRVPYWMVHYDGNLFEKAVLDKQIYCFVHTPPNRKIRRIQQTEIEISNLGNDEPNTYILQTYAHETWLQASLFYNPKENHMVRQINKPILTVVTKEEGNYMIIRNLTASGNCKKGALRCRRKPMNKGG